MDRLRPVRFAAHPSLQAELSKGTGGCCCYFCSEADEPGESSRELPPQRNAQREDENREQREFKKPITTVGRQTKDPLNEMHR